MISDSLSKGLKLLDLSDLACKIYLVLVKNPQKSIVNLAKELSSNRNAVYTAIAELEEIGLLYPKKEYERSQEVASPSKIASLLETKRHQDSQVIDSVVSSLPTILSDLYSSNTSQIFKVYRTKEQIMARLHQLYFDSKEEIYFLGNEGLTIDLIGFQFLKQVIAQRLKQKIPIKVLISDINRYILTQKPHNQAELRSYRVLTKNNAIDANFHVIGEIVFMINPVIPMAYLIQDKLIANMFKQMFLSLWEQAQEV